MQTAYTQGMDQFNTEQDRARQAQEQTNKYGLLALDAQQTAGGVQRGIEQQGIAADYAQFREERDDPYKKLQYQQSLLQGLPIAAQETEFVGQSGLSEILGQVGSGAEIWNTMYGGECPEGMSRNWMGICTK